MKTIYTIGHSNRSFEDFAKILHAHQIEMILDVRSMPGSRKHPQFGKGTLRGLLITEGIAYRHVETLGGYRKGHQDPSVNMGWRNESFRNYADYMQTPEFTCGIGEATSIALVKRVAYMCSEAVPWRCHRSLISDALLVRGWNVMDIYSETQAKPHKLTSFAVVDGLRITYPVERDLLSA